MELVLFLCSVLIYFNLKYSLAREKQLTAEKNEAALQIKYEKEEQARLKAEQELLTLQQQKLQNEVMANQLHLQHKNDVLLQLKEKLSNQESVNIQQIIREETLTDNDFEKAKFHIQEMHPEFFNNLNKQAKQKLTTLDLKYCAYLYLGMDTKMIANLLNVEPKSVRMTKYRLKQKFDLNAETDLVNYIKEIG
ncbi:helix-turn-helix transcriptional regulator [Chryseobacterium oranimense]|uniref:helix-turn-helix transcriptional regulator n=1 Tax=Chryseobacterium oranimense TaxID=421058 RepID=UPI001114FA0B|nr:LuxR C-terminal-related transcriptional regulator [Chryseobacterium oranimense]